MIYADDNLADSSHQMNPIPSWLSASPLFQLMCHWVLVHTLCAGVQVQTQKAICQGQAVVLCSCSQSGKDSTGRKIPEGSIWLIELPAGSCWSRLRSSKHAEVIFSFPSQRRLKQKKKSWKINIIHVFHRRHWTDLRSNRCFFKCFFWGASWSIKREWENI